MQYICSKGPVCTEQIKEHLESSKQNESAGRKPLVDAGLILNIEEGWVATNVGRALMAMMAYEEE